MALPAGYSKYAYNDAFEELVGLLGYKVEGDTISFAFRADARHRNTGDSIHGGMLMTFADFALCLTAVWNQPEERCVTVSLNCEFVAAGREGDLIESVCEVVRGTLFVGDRILLNFSGSSSGYPAGARRGEPDDR